ncbi:putative quinol monooxygenase [Embleya scabrispora]|uniref:putative quinol monooxygenase n=1 Tax=Embleya scabrispora TaxID=159449 RepID=UPI000374DB33|nr:antibiotic biosynthesis monooxygenase family protein [Embleya scabrispora]MYS83188.1 antibiotic biosynthesis monooxygenase [Streptomyces sp. SID5474]
MSHVVVARYRTNPDTQEQVLALLDEMTRRSLAEPGCRGYRVHQGVEDERTIVLYEEYEAEADFTAHCASEHFRDIVLARVVPLLESRDVVRLTPRAAVEAAQ